MSSLPDVDRSRATAPELSEVEAAARFRSLFEQASHLAAMLDLDGNLLEVNQRFLEASGFRRSDVLGRPLWVCGWWNREPELMERVRASVLGAARGETSRTVSSYFVADGSERFVDLVLSPVKSSAGQPDFLAATGSDITDQRHIERELQEANRRKDEFLATASHELRTPLNAILGWARLMRSGQLDAKGVGRAIETIERNAVAQVRLIEDILDGSRILTGKLQLETRPLELARTVQAALDALKPLAAAKQIALVAALTPDAAWVQGDPDRLQQVVWNLVDNALKFTPRGGRIDVALVFTEGGVRLTVKDSGQGIRADFLPHVFERFRQADGSTTRRQGGLGLGLALVKHLVEAHAGTVGVESEGDGHGAIFWVDLPRQGIATSSAPPAESAAVSEIDLRGISVLIVDDEPDARELVALVLQSSGAHVTTAASAEQALLLLSRRTPQLLISDIGMPGTDGYELIKRIRARAGSEPASLPAIALTAYFREEDRRRALAAGFQVHVSKPVEPDSLLRVVANLLGTR